MHAGLATDVDAALLLATDGGVQVTTALTVVSLTVTVLVVVPTLYEHQ